MDNIFSIIIPTLNEEKNLAICLESLMNQTYKNFEAIIVDGGSKDRTRDIVELYGFQIITVEKTRPHDVSVAKNRGAENAKGDILLFLDADMILEPNCLEVLNGYYKIFSVIGIACKILPLQGNGIENTMYQINNLLARFSNRMGLHELSYFSCHSYRKNIFMKVGGFREDLNACEDLDLSLRIRRLGKYIVTPEITIWTSPRRLRKWSYGKYLRRYLRYLVQYYLSNKITDYYEDL